MVKNILVANEITTLLQKYLYNRGFAPREGKICARDGLPLTTRGRNKNRGFAPRAGSMTSQRGRKGPVC